MSDEMHDRKNPDEHSAELGNMSQRCTPYINYPLHNRSPTAARNNIQLAQFTLDAEVQTNW
jgi:hypothetical protein